MRLRKHWAPALLLGTVFLALSCGPRATLVGTVRDYFGGPLEGVTVEITGTQLNTVTAKDGTYSLEYLPGRFRLNFVKDGYHESHLDFEITSETKVPVAEMPLLRLPTGQGMYYVNDSEYQMLPRGKLRYETIEADHWSNFRTSAYKAEGEFVKLALASPLRFLDNDGESTSLFSVGNDDVVLTSRYRSGKTRDDGDLQDESVEEIVPGYLRHETDLRPGRYAFVAVRWREISLNRSVNRIGARLHPVTTPVYLFEITEDQPSAGLGSSRF